MSAYEMLTGKKGEDWLAMLGFPASETRAPLASAA